MGVLKLEVLLHEYKLHKLFLLLNHVMDFLINFLVVYLTVRAKVNIVLAQEVK